MAERFKRCIVHRTMLDQYQWEAKTMLRVETGRDAVFYGAYISILGNWSSAMQQLLSRKSAMLDKRVLRKVRQFYLSCRVVCEWSFLVGAFGVLEDIRAAYLRCRGIMRATVPIDYPLYGMNATQEGM